MTGAAQTLRVLRRGAPRGLTAQAICDGARGVPEASRVTRDSTGAGEQRLGLLAAALCALTGAFVPAVAKLTTAAASPLAVAAASNLAAAVAALAVLAARGELGALVERRRVGRLLAIAALGTAAAHLLFYLGASRTTAIVAILCLQIEPAYALLLAWLVLGHRPTARRVAATGLLLAGIALATGAGAGATTGGVWFLLATPLCWQLSHLIVLRTLGGVPEVVLTSARYAYGGLMLVGLWAALEGSATLPAAAALGRQLPLLVLQGCVLGYAGTLLWYLAIARIDLARATAIVVPSIPLLSLAASFALLGEVATPAQWAGLALTAVGIAAFVADERHPR